MTNPFPRELLTSIEVAALAAWNETQQQAFRYRYSSAGGSCIRALSLEAAGAKNEIGSVHHMLMAACGKAVGAAIEAGALKLGWATQEYVELPDSAVLVSGNLDFASPEIVMDGKLVNEKQWRKVQREPRFKDQFQVNGYAVSSKRPFWGLLYLRATSIFGEAGKLDWRIFTGKADPALALAMARTWEIVDAHKTAGTLPQIPIGFTKESYPCSWPRSRTPGACPHFATCWEKPNVRNANGGSAERARPELLSGAAADDQGHVRQRSDGSGVSGLHGGGAGAGAEPDHPADPSGEAVERGAEAKRLDAADGN